MTEVMKWAFVGDLQMPYHDKRAVDLWFKVMKAWKPDIIDFVGDIDDQLEYSTFATDTTEEFFNVLKNNQKANEKEQAAIDKQIEAFHRVAQEMQQRGEPVPDMPEFKFEPKPVDPLPFVKENADCAREFYTAVRKQHKNAEMHSSLGNHDIRVFKYLDKKAPDYVEQVTPNFLWGLDDLGITWRHYELPPLERHAGIHVHHGATVTTTGLAVRNDIETYNISLVRGHDHRGGVVYKSYPMTGGSLAGMGCGHLCDPAQMTYTVNPSWEKGFGIAYIVNGKAHLQFIPMRNYTCVVDGKVFEG
jgi:hypothetical protein